MLKDLKEAEKCVLQLREIYWFFLLIKHSHMTVLKSVLPALLLIKYICL